MFALLPDGALRPGVRRREVFGWALYDFANSGYTTVVLTAVFSAYFVSAVAGAASWATLLWTLAIGLSNAIVMLLMPALGAWADQRAAKKRLLMLVTLLCLLATAALALGQLHRIITAVRGVEGAGAPPATLDTTLEIDVNSNRIMTRRWSRHPRCEC